MIVDILSNKKLNPIVTELFIRGRKLNISVVLITHSYFAVPKNIRLNSTHYFIMKISNKWELKQTASHNSSDIDFNGLWTFTTNVPQNHILFKLLMLLLNQIIL